MIQAHQIRPTRKIFRETAVRFIVEFLQKEPSSHVQFKYGGFDRFSVREFAEVAFRGLGLIGHAGFGFRRLAMEEVLKYSRRRMVSLAGELVEGVKLDQYADWGKPGIRAQLLDVPKRRLEMDFVVEGDDRSMHVLNAVSPAFTCSLPFSEYVCDRIRQLVN